MYLLPTFQAVCHFTFFRFHDEVSNIFELLLFIFHIFVSHGFIDTSITIPYYSTIIPRYVSPLHDTQFSLLEVNFMLGLFHHRIVWEVLVSTQLYDYNSYDRWSINYCQHFNFQQKFRLSRNAPQNKSPSVRGKPPKELKRT